MHVCNAYLCTDHKFLPKMLLHWSGQLLVTVYMWLWDGTSQPVDAMLWNMVDQTCYLPSVTAQLVIDDEHSRLHSFWVCSNNLHHCMQTIFTFNDYVEPCTFVSCYVTLRTNNIHHIWFLAHSGLVSHPKNWTFKLHCTYLLSTSLPSEMATVPNLHIH